MNLDRFLTGAERRGFAAITAILLHEETQYGIDFNNKVSTTVKISSAAAGRQVME